jgi:hypothetical protein
VFSAAMRNRQLSVNELIVVNQQNEVTRTDVTTFSIASHNNNSSAAVALNVTYSRITGGGLNEVK